MKFARNFAILALVALALVVLPGGAPLLNVVLTVLTIAFFVAIALFGVRLYRENRFRIDSLEPSSRLVLYSSIGAAFLTFTATRRLFDLGGVGVLVWLGLLAVCSYGIFWVYARSRRYG
jgi:hypothetical protein